RQTDPCGGEFRLFGIARRNGYIAATQQFADATGRRRASRNGGPSEDQAQRGEDEHADDDRTEHAAPPQKPAEAAALVRGDVDAIYVKGSLGLETAHLIGAQPVIDIGF
ncbi:hypothetical protein QM306_40215, partial [Burkholderia cenocepacia]|nr:hypothetical protein [Burkholderia cenocepacia]